ncbi:zinc finger protein, putative [Plasmodium ovale wallikeri]|uniref:Zinc finger protein, putative n=2 Tax=Plasmodium ovale TaxID=36330 RepID=A0A1A8YNU1_PLAOA|nr:zinc finger protein, putative [Plasmodium ovale wallikeri]SBT33178.1 zinc finger protein, putative [Plasmodium ovale wallikeri]SBT76026.1 zinc finger protein, putative [Plasmodium ovale]
MHRFKIYKIQMCKYALINKCDRGENCTFAHDISELRIKPDMRKTKLCKSYILGKCTDDNCIYAHSVNELREVGKPAICQLHREGRCIKGNQCRFAHSINDINTKLVQFYDSEDVSNEEEGNELLNMKNCLHILNSGKGSSMLSSIKGYADMRDDNRNREVLPSISRKKDDIWDLNINMIDSSSNCSNLSNHIYNTVTGKKRNEIVRNINRANLVKQSSCNTFLSSNVNPQYRKEKKENIILNHSKNMKNTKLYAINVGNASNTNPCSSYDYDSLLLDRNCKKSYVHVHNNLKMKNPSGNVLNENVNKNVPTSLNVHPFSSFNFPEQVPKNDDNDRLNNVDSITNADVRNYEFMNKFNTMNRRLKKDTVRSVKEGINPTNTGIDYVEGVGRTGVIAREILFGNDLLKGEQPTGEVLNKEEGNSIDLNTCNKKQKNIHRINELIASVNYLNRENNVHVKNEYVDVESGVRENGEIGSPLKHYYADDMFRYAVEGVTEEGKKGGIDINESGSSIYDMVNNANNGSSLIKGGKKGTEKVENVGTMLGKSGSIGRDYAPYVNCIDEYRLSHYDNVHQEQRKHRGDPFTSIQSLFPRLGKIDTHAQLGKDGMNPRSFMNHTIGVNGNESFNHISDNVSNSVEKVSSRFDFGIHREKGKDYHICGSVMQNTLLNGDSRFKGENAFENGSNREGNHSGGGNNHYTDPIGEEQCSGVVVVEVPGGDAEMSRGQGIVSHLGEREGENALREDHFVAKDGPVYKHEWEAANDLPVRSYKRPGNVFSYDSLVVFNDEEEEYPRDRNICVDAISDVRFGKNKNVYYDKSGRHKKCAFGTIKGRSSLENSAQNIPKEGLTYIDNRNVSNAYFVLNNGEENSGGVVHKERGSNNEANNSLHIPSSLTRSEDHTHALRRPPPLRTVNSNDIAEEFRTNASKEGMGMGTRSGRSGNIAREDIHPVSNTPKGSPSLDDRKREFIDANAQEDIENNESTRKGISSRAGDAFEATAKRSNIMSLLRELAVKEDETNLCNGETESNATEGDMKIDMGCDEVAKFHQVENTMERFSRGGGGAGGIAFSERCHGRSITQKRDSKDFSIEMRGEEEEVTSEAVAVAIGAVDSGAEEMDSFFRTDGSRGERVDFTNYEMYKLYDETIETNYPKLEGSRGKGDEEEVEEERDRLYKCKIPPICSVTNKKRIPKLDALNYDERKDDKEGLYDLFSYYKKNKPFIAYAQAKGDITNEGTHCFSNFREQIDVRHYVKDEEEIYPQDCKDRKDNRMKQRGTFFINTYTDEGNDNWNTHTKEGKIDRCNLKNISFACARISKAETNDSSAYLNRCISNNLDPYRFGNSAAEAGTVDEETAGVGTSCEMATQFVSKRKIASAEEEHPAKSYGLSVYGESACREIPYGTNIFEENKHGEIAYHENSEVQCDKSRRQRFLFHEDDIDNVETFIKVNAVSEMKEKDATLCRKSRCIMGSDQIIPPQVILEQINYDQVRNEEVNNYDLFRYEQLNYDSAGENVVGDENDGESDGDDIGRSALSFLGYMKEGYNFTGNNMHNNALSSSSAFFNYDVSKCLENEIVGSAVGNGVSSSSVFGNNSCLHNAQFKNRSFPSDDDTFCVQLASDMTFSFLSRND